MIDFIKNLYKIYKATKEVNTVNKDGSIQVYNFVECKKHLYIVISKDICDKYGFSPDLQFIKEGGNKDE
jgi:hypothetical protein